MSNKKDMHLPVWVLLLGIVFLLGAAVCAYYALTASVYAWLGVAACVGFGVAAVLCWANQWAVMVDDDSFVYSTMFGKKKQYRFSDIKDLKMNSDSYTLICEDGDIHIEHCAVMSDRFMNAVNSVLEKKQ